MVDLIIFSKNRAMQLDLLIRSIKRFCGNLFKTINVFYICTDDFFKKGYEKIQNVNLFYEKNFYVDFINILSNCDDLVCLLCDDCIFYSEVNSEEVIEIINKEEIFSYILGIGLNSVYSGSLGKFFNQPKFAKNKNSLIYNWKQCGNSEFNCPIMFAGNIYKKQDLMFCLSGNEPFTDPYSFEVLMHRKWRFNEWRRMKDYCACPIQQSLVHTMNNRVLGDFNPLGKKFPISSQELNRKFLEGYIIDFKKLDFKNINGLHQEIDLFLIKNKFLI